MGAESFAAGRRLLEELKCAIAAIACTSFALNLTGRQGLLLPNPEAQPRFPRPCAWLHQCTLHLCCNQASDYFYGIVTSPTGRESCLQVLTLWSPLQTPQHWVFTI